MVVDRRITISSAIAIANTTTITITMTITFTISLDQNLPKAQALQKARIPLMLAYSKI